MNQKTYWARSISKKSTYESCFIALKRQPFKLCMKKLIYFVFALTVTGCNNNEEPALETAAETAPKFIKSAHYFSSAWPVTFWQEFEEDDVSSELKQIKKDGFNTIVLVVPWRGFEIGFENEQTESNPILYERLTFVLKAIVEHNLKFILRLGFPHYHMPEAKTYALEQCIGMYTNEKTQNHWIDYLEKVSQSIKPFQESSAGILVTWEDFWCPHSLFPKWSEEKRLEMAQAMGYEKWLQQQNQNMVKVLLQQSDIRFDQIKVPLPADFSYVLYLDFIDQMFEQKVLKPAQSIFPNAAMEIRVDKLPIKQKEQYTWIGHDLHLEESNLRGTYWAPFWGAENKGELISAEQALKNFNYLLKTVSDNGNNINHLVEQFNFYDNTVHYPNNANIKPEEIDDFLLGAAPLLKKYSRGFGVWAYRDYHDSAILNGSFEMGTEGWHIDGLAEIQTQQQDQSLLMQAGSSITQRFLADKRFKLLVKYQNITLCVMANQKAVIEVKVDGVVLKEWQIEPEQNCTQISAEPFKLRVPLLFSIQAQSEVLIDEIKLFGFTQMLGLYDAEGNPAQNLDAYRKLNGLFK